MRLSTGPTIMSGSLPGRGQLVIIIILTVAGRPGPYKGYRVTHNLVHHLRGKKQESPLPIPLRETLSSDLPASVGKHPNNIHELLENVENPHKRTRVFVFCRDGYNSLTLNSHHGGGSQQSQLPADALEASGTRHSKSSESEGFLTNCLSVPFPESEVSTNHRQPNASLRLLRRLIGLCRTESNHITDVLSVLEVSRVGKQEVSPGSFTSRDVMGVLASALAPSTCRQNPRGESDVIPEGHISLLFVNVYEDYAPTLYSLDLNTSMVDCPRKEDTRPEANPLADECAEFTELVEDLPEISQKQPRKHFSPFWSKLFNSLFHGDSLQVKVHVAPSNANNYVFNTAVREIMLLLMVLLTLAFRPLQAFDVEKTKIRNNVAFLEDVIKLFFMKWTWAFEGQEKKKSDEELVDGTISDKKRSPRLKSSQLDLMNSYIYRPWLQKAPPTQHGSCCSSYSPLCCSCQNVLMPGSQRTVTVGPAFLPYPSGNPSEDLAHVGYRLATLAALPASSPVSRIRLADAGFYSRGDGDQVACFSCGVRHSDWRAGDVPLDVHRQLSPNCQHVLQRDRESAELGSGRGWLSEHANASVTVSNDPNSARGHPAPQSQSSPLPPPPPAPPEEDSEAYRPPTSSSSATSTARNTASSPDHGSSPSLAVSSAQSSEGRATGAGPAGTRRIMTAVHPSDAASAASTAVARPPVFPRARLELGGAVYPAYNSIAHRRRTFTRWDETQAPPLNQILLSGMFYAGYADCVRCFYCGVGLKSWVVTDSVWDEHVRWRPECAYLRAVKGEDFIRESQRRLGIEPSVQVQNGHPQPPPPPPPAPLSAPPSAPPSQPPSDQGARAQSVASSQHSSSSSSSSTSDDVSGSATTATTASNGATSHGSAPSSTSTPPTVTSSSAAGTPGPTASVSPSAASAAAAATAGSMGGGSASMTSASGGDPGVRVSDAAGEHQHLGQLQAENQRLARELTCRVCRRLPVDVILFPCAHLVVCENCSGSVTSCPLCREHVTARIQIAEDSPTPP